MAIARTFRDLKVYQLAEEAAQIIFLLSRQFPVEERYSNRSNSARLARSESNGCGGMGPTPLQSCVHQ
jgi:hypothetical protein